MDLTDWHKAERETDRVYEDVKARQDRNTRYYLAALRGPKTPFKGLKIRFYESQSPKLRKERQEAFNAWLAVIDSHPGRQG